MLKDGTDVFGSLKAADRALLRAAEIGFVFQNFQLIPYLTAFENILTPKLAVAEAKAAAHAAAESLLRRFGLEARRNHLPDEMSIGERQRTALARSLMNKPQILLADEPTGNLDPQNTEIVMDHLRDFHKSGGTVLLVTHDRNLCAHAQQTIRMESGRIAAA
jgi:putative ABC transport system ATP-binding protein